MTLIHNAAAGDDNQPDGQALTALVRDAGHRVVYQACGNEPWEAALDEAADVVAVAGGDGTVGRVAKKLIGRDIPVAPLPLGTANNISKTLGLTDLALDGIVAGWTHACRVTFDVGVAKGPWGSRYFIEGIGIGLFACTIPVADESPALASIDDASEKVSYAVRMLRERLAHCPQHELELTLDGRDMSGTYVLFEAMNMEFVGPNLYLAPDILPADGLLDVVLVTAAEREKLNAALAKWQHGDLQRPDLRRVRARKIALRWSGFDLHFDDEAWPAEGEEPPALSPIEVALERNALSFLAPAARDGT